MNKTFLLSPREWQEFFMEDVVSIENGKRLTKNDMQNVVAVSNKNTETIKSGIKGYYR